jgi:two-component system, cell cycle sensor histidine kinase and response regulator CckA
MQDSLENRKIFVPDGGVNLPVSSAVPIRILHLDDKSTESELVWTQLRQSGMNVDLRRVETERTFLLELATFDPAIVLADFQLAQWSATEALKALRTAAPETPFIVVSNPIGEEAVADLFRAGASDFVLKSGPGRLPNAIERELLGAESRRQQGRALTELHEEKQRLQHMADSLPVLISYVDRELRYQFVNLAYETWFGCSASQIKGQTLEAVLGQAAYGRIENNVKRVLAGERFSFETEIEYRHAGKRHVHVHYAPHRSHTGEVLGYFALVEDVTERKRAEAEHEKLAVLIEHSADFIAMADLEGRLTYMNPGACRMIGFDDSRNPNELKFTDYVPEEWAAFFHNTVIATARERGLWEGEMQLRHLKTGTLINVFRSVFLIRDSRTGEPLCFATVTRDITAQKRAQESLRASEERFQLVSTATQDTIWDWNLSTNRVWWSEGIHTIWGFTPDQIQPTGEWWVERIHPDDLETVVAEVMACLESNATSWSGEYRYRRADGSYAHVLDRGYILRDADGRALRMIGSEQDISARKETELRYRTLFEQAGVGVALVDSLTGQILESNQRYAEILGRKHEELKATTFKAVTHPDDLPGDLMEMERLRAGTIRRFTREKRYVRPDGSIVWASVTVSPLWQPHETPFRHIAVVQDITERKRMEDTVRAAEKIAATGQMAARIAHEINNPLGAIKNAFWLLKDAVPREHPSFKHVALIDRELNRVREIIWQMLILYRPAAKKPNDFSLPRLVESVFDMLSVKVRVHEVVTVLAVDTADVPVRLPEGPVIQILLNLISNAVEVSPKGRRVSVAVRCDGGWVRVTVTDEGPGIPESLRGQLFKPFFTTKDGSTGSGMGLGLSVSRSLVEAMGGQLDFESPPDGGTVFWFSVPRILPVSPEEKQDALPSQEASE